MKKKQCSNRGRGNTRILFLSSGPFALNRRVWKDKFTYFGYYYSGDFIAPVNVATGKLTGLRKVELEKTILLHPFNYYYGNSLIRYLKSIYSFIRKSFGIYYIENRRFDVVISHDPLLTGLVSCFIGKVTGARVIVEVNGNFESAFKYGRTGRAELTLEEKMKDKISRLIIRFVIKRADVVKLVSANQLKPLFDSSMLRDIETYSFPNYVPIQYFSNGNNIDKKYILLLGYPWYLKGVDILIRAFNIISEDFPEYRLKIVGWCPDGREYFEKLTEGNLKIELCDAVAHQEVVTLMGACSVYVLASRTDASPRVLREAMASRKPIIAANIDGVPDLIKDGYNGILFEKGNVDALAEKLRLILSNKGLADRMAQRGYDYVHENLSELRYVAQFNAMIENVMQKR